MARMLAPSKSSLGEFFDSGIEDRGPLSQSSVVVRLFCPDASRRPEVSLVFFAILAFD